MYFKQWIIFIIAVSWGIDRYFSFREETGNGLIRLLKKNPLLITTLLIFGLVYLIDLIDGQYVWIAFLFGSGFMLAMIISSAKRLRRKIQHLLGFGFVLLCFVNVLCYTRYELQHQFHRPCWSPDGKQIAFFMEKNLIQYRFGLIVGWSPNPLWHKYYLCTMDYDGKNFKQIKQTEQATDEISWSGSGEIVYTQEVMQDVDTVLQRKIIYTSPDGKETGTLYETAKIPTKIPIKENGRILDPWLSKDKRCLGFVLNYREPKKTSEEDIRLGRFYDNYELIVKDLRTQQTKIDILQRDVESLRYREFYGAYNMSKVAYYNNDILEICDLGNNEIIKIDMLEFKQDGYLPSFSTWDLSGTYLLGMKDKFDIEKRELVEQNNSWYLNTGIVAPNGEMRASAGIIWDKNDKTIGIIKVNPRRSYLFNIFREIGD